MLSYVLKHSKLRKTTKVIKLQWIASIWHQNDLKCSVTSQNIQNNAKLQKWSNYNELHRFYIKTIKKFELRRKTFKTTQNYESHQITMNFIDLMSKHQTNAELQKWSYFDEFASIWHQNDQNNANLRKSSNYNACINLTSKRSKELRYVVTHSKLRKTTKVIKLQWIAKDLTSKRSKMF